MGRHTCAVSTAGALLCWGFNFSGQADVPEAAQSGMAQVTSGSAFTCGLSVAGGVTCWGYNRGGQTIVPAAAQSGVAQISSGWVSTCALSTAGALACWGDNYSGLTDGPTQRVLPTATFGAPSAAVILGGSFPLTLTNAQVPGYPSATTFTYAFDCGSGTYGSASATASVSCAATTAGVRTARGRVIDQDGDATEYTASVTVVTPAQATGALRELVLASTLAPDIRRALSAKLDDAIKALAAGKTKSACSALADFAKQVQAQRGKAISSAIADAWLVEVTAIRTAAGC
jgi:alpha-tubulin suppressor-like RCC1 family protein